MDREPAPLRADDMHRAMEKMAAAGIDDDQAAKLMTTASHDRAFIAALVGGMAYAARGFR